MKIKGRQPHRRLALEYAPPDWLCPVEARQRMGMTRVQFASTFGISVSTLRQWETGRRRPRGPSLILIDLISRDPRPVQRAIAHACRIETDRKTLVTDDDDVT